MENTKAVKGDRKFQGLRRDCNFNKNVQGKPY